MDLARLLNNAKRLFKNEKYAFNENAPVLSAEQYSAINIGAINAEQNCYYCNCLETETDKTDVRNRLRDYYEIIDRKSAGETLDWLLNRGHSVYFEAIRPVITDSASEFNTDVLSEDEKDRSLLEYVNNIKESLEVLIDEHVIQNAGEFKTLSIKAWDFGRLVLTARCCYDSKYISEEETWRYILNAYEQSKELYHDWREFAKGYLAGRAMWNGNDISLRGIISIADGLINDDNSPWIKYPLH